MSAQNAHAAVRPVEGALSALHERLPQIKIAEAAGFDCHSAVSRRLAKVLGGEVGGFLDAYTMRQGLMLALSDEQLGTAMRSALTVPVSSANSLPDQIARLIAESGKLISLAADAIADREISHRERTSLDAELVALQTMIEATRRDLASAT